MIKSYGFFFLLIGSIMDQPEFPLTRWHWCRGESECGIYVFERIWTFVSENGTPGFGKNASFNSTYNIVIKQILYTCRKNICPHFIFASFARIVSRQSWKWANSNVLNYRTTLFGRIQVRVKQFASETGKNNNMGQK